MSRAEMLAMISDCKSQELFSAIAKNTENENILASLQLSRKHYYSRITKLLGYGLVKRKNRKYILTQFRKVIYELQLVLASAIKYDSIAIHSSPIKK